MEEKSIKEVEASRTSCSHLLFPRHLNAYGKLFGGQLLEWIDELAGIVAMRHSNSFVVTANMSNVQFHSSAEATEILYMEGYVCMYGWQLQHGTGYPKFCRKSKWRKTAYQHKLCNHGCRRRNR